MKRRSPIRCVTHHNEILNAKLSKWVCDESRLLGAKFQDRKLPHHTAVLHRSPKIPGYWQVSYFSDGVPWGDTQYRSCQEAVGGYVPSRWRLRKVIWRTDCP